MTFDILQYASYNLGLALSELEILGFDGKNTGVNAIASALVANEVLSLYHLGGKEGAYVTDNNGVMTQYSSSARTVTAQMTTVGATTAGKTRIIVIWVKPTDTVTSDFVAS